MLAKAHRRSTSLSTGVAIIALLGLGACSDGRAGLDFGSSPGIVGGGGLTSGSGSSGGSGSAGGTGSGVGSVSGGSSVTPGFVDVTVAGTTIGTGGAPTATGGILSTSGNSLLPVTTTTNSSTAFGISTSAPIPLNVSLNGTGTASGLNSAAALTGLTGSGAPADVSIDNNSVLDGSSSSPLGVSALSDGTTPNGSLATIGAANSSGTNVAMNTNGITSAATSTILPTTALGGNGLISAGAGNGSNLLDGGSAPLIGVSGGSNTQNQGSLLTVGAGSANQTATVQTNTTSLLNGIVGR